jgi:uncharacterized oxidoreductase
MSSTAEGREAIFNWVKANAPEVNILVNNAGIQRRINWKDDNISWAEKQKEIDINAAAPVHLTHLFGEWFVSRGVDAAIVNVSSGLAYIPPAFAPVYGATKAFIHSFTQSVRFHFQNTKVRIVELAPPAVKSNLGGAHDFGMETADFCHQAFHKFAQGSKEFGVEMSEAGRLADRGQRLAMMERMANGAHDVKPY